MCRVLFLFLGSVAFSCIKRTSVRRETFYIISFIVYKKCGVDFNILTVIEERTEYGWLLYRINIFQSSSIFLD